MAPTLMSAHIPRRPGQTLTMQIATINTLCRIACSACLPDGELGLLAGPLRAAETAWLAWMLGLAG